MTTASKLPSRTTMLRAVAERNVDWDGIFVFAVTTTRVVCRPGCPSRRARPDHVAFFASVSAAEDAGYRPCRRCRPEGAVAPPSWLPRLMKLVSEDDSRRLSDAVLTQLDFDPIVIRRHFHRHHGSTFHAWVRARRIAAAQRQLKGGAMLDRVIINSGWHSHSGFRDAFKQVVGFPPGRARGSEAITITTMDSPLGPLTCAAVDDGIVMLEFGDKERLPKQTASLQRWFGGPVINGSHRHLIHLAMELDEYFAGKRQRFTAPLVVRGTPFEERVWHALSEIPYGTTCSYTDIARAVGSPLGVRAVGGANGRNRIAIVIPCHRVINAGGALGGYGGGLWRKKRLLELEGVPAK